VNPLPAAISGPSDVCVGQTITLGDPTAGGTWSSSDPATATAGLTTGIIGGVTPGTVSVTYTLPTGCATSVIINVDSLPSALSGPDKVCVGSVITLSSATGGLGWSSSNPSVAMVDGFGDVTGISAGVATITGTGPGGCAASMVVTVNPVPFPITGPVSICQGQTVSLGDFSGGGIWSSSDGTIATIDSVTGVLTGLLPGGVVISYTFPGTGCAMTRSEVVNPGPDPIAGPNAICVGTTIPMSDATVPGAWSSTNPSVATVDVSGNVTGSTTGTATISYTLPTGCAATKPVTVNPVPGAITGPTQVCVGSTIALTDIVPGGTWASDDPSVASVDIFSGTVYGMSGPASTNITYSLGAGCTTYTTIAVNPLPDPITGIHEKCVGQSVTLFDPTPAGGIWSSTTTGVATIDAGGTVVGVAAGTTIISYADPVTGCAATFEFTVDPTPTAIVGNPDICLGSTRTYVSTPGGGTWTSSVPSVASIDPSSGVATGASLGNAILTYTLYSSCPVSKAVTVVSPPATFNVTGGGSYCAGGSGVLIGLDGSATGVDYYLYLGATATGTFAGTGSALSFGLQTVAGVYTVIATSTSTTCSSYMSGSATVSINPSILPSVSISPSPNDTVCAGASTTFTASPVFSGPGPVYQWAVNGVNVGTGSSYTFIPADGDVVKITMTSNYPCALPATVHDTLRMTVLPFERPVAAINVSPNDTVCQGTLVNLSAMPGYGGTAPVYTWIRNGSVAATGTTYSYVPENRDSLRVLMLSNYLCILDSDRVSSPELVMTVDTPLLPLVSISASPGTSIGRNESDTLRATVTNGGESPKYQWYVNGWPVTGATTNTYISNNYSIVREDSVSCVVTSDAVCSMTSHQWVYINATDVGVKQIGGAGDITVVPNPNKGEFIVKGTLGTNLDQEVSLELTDMLGQVVYSSKVQAQGGRINERVTLAHSIANGMYLLSVHTDTENKVFHIVIEQ